MTTLEEDLRTFLDKAGAFEDVKVLLVRVGYLTEQVTAIRGDVQDLKKSVDARIDEIDKSLTMHREWANAKFTTEEVEIANIKNNPAVVKTGEWIKNHEKIHVEQESFHRWTVGTIIGIIVAIGTVAAAVGYFVMH